MHVVLIHMHIHHSTVPSTSTDVRKLKCSLCSSSKISNMMAAEARSTSKHRTQRREHQPGRLSIGPPSNLPLTSNPGPQSCILDFEVTSCQNSIFDIQIIVQLFVISACSVMVISCVFCALATKTPRVTV